MKCKHILHVRLSSLDYQKAKMSQFLQCDTTTINIREVSMKWPFYLMKNASTKFIQNKSRSLIIQLLPERNVRILMAFIYSLLYIESSSQPELLLIWRPRNVWYVPKN